MNPTDRVPLASTGLEVTRLGLGTAPLGNMFTTVAEEEATAVVRRAYELGLRLYDTAPLYGHGLAERRLGAGLRELAGDGGDVVVCTKVGRLLRADAPLDPTQIRDDEYTFCDLPPENPVFDFSYDGVMRSVDESVERMGVDGVDVLHIHDPDDHHDEALEGAYRAVDRLRADGTISAVGAGMNQAEMLARFAREADFDCFLLAGRYSLLDQSGLAELLPLCRQRGIAVIIGGVYNSGILARPEPGAPYDYLPAPEGLLDGARRLESVCARYDVPLAAAAIQFPFGHPAVATVLTGSRSVAELEENERMLRWDIPDDLWAELKGEGLLGADVPVPDGEGR